MKLNSYVLSKFYYMEEKNMTKEMQFKNIVAQYCEVKPEDMNGDMRFREDLGFSSLDFMSFLGELEDEEALKIRNVSEALELLNTLV